MKILSDYFKKVEEPAKYKLLFNFMVETTEDLQIYYLLLHDKFILKVPDPLKFVKVELDRIQDLFKDNRTGKIALLKWHEIDFITKESVCSTLKLHSYIRISDCLKAFSSRYISDYYQTLMEGTSSLELLDKIKKTHQGGYNMLPLIYNYCLAFSLVGYKNFLLDEYGAELESGEYIEKTEDNGPRNFKDIVPNSDYNIRLDKLETIFKPRVTYSTFEWQKNPKLIEVLFEELINRESPLISEYTPKDVFIKAFKGNEIEFQPKIIWNESKNLLAYFFKDGLMKYNFIFNKAEYSSIVNKSKIFIDKKGKVYNNLKQGVDQYKNSKSGKPKGFEEIDLIIEKLKNI